jgi:hypothetical protein
MDRLQISVPVEFCSLGLGSKSKSKSLKAKPVVRLLGDERMFFSYGCEGLQELYTELEKFTGTSDDAHDDIVSAISLLVEQFGGYAEMASKIDFASVQYATNLQETERHNQIYGLGKYAKYNATNQADDNPVTTYQLENIRRFRDEEFGDPLADLM